MVTQLPSGYGNFDKRCREQANITFDIFLSRVTEQALRFGFQNNAKILCGDMLFSGHTVAVVTSALFVAYYLPPRLQFLRWIPYLLAASAATCLIISHTHYTIDILVAYWLSNFVFRTYHAFCEIDIVIQRRNSILYGNSMLWIVEWLEDDIASGKATNKFESPFDGLFRELRQGRCGEGLHGRTHEQHVRGVVELQRPRGEVTSRGQHRRRSA
ncbi:hypothetical protein OSTOST_09156 [Ostertagia ostertagi]